MSLIEQASHLRALPLMNNVFTLDLGDYERHLLAQGFTPATRRTLLGVVRSCALDAGCKPPELTGDDVVGFLSRDLAPATRRAYLWALRSYAEWGQLGPITASVRKPRIPRAAPRPCSEPDLALLLAAATPRTRAFVMLGAYAGLRSFETAKVAGRHFEGTPTGQGLRVAGKGGREDVLPVPGILMREMASWVKDAGPGRLWPDVTGGAVQQAIRHASEQAGVEVSSHQLRHRYGTQLYAVSRDLLIVQRLMRHSSPVTTAGYAKVTDETGAALVDRLP